jgi:hypothetical protein
MTTTTVTPIPPQHSQLSRCATVVTNTAVVVNAAVFGLASVGGVKFQFPRPGAENQTQTVNMITVVAATLTSMTAGWTLVAMAVRRHRPTLHTMTIIGGAAAAISTVAPLSLHTGTSLKFTLASLHLLAGAYFVIGAVVLEAATTRSTR